jgi:hypothetical protein
MEEVSTRTQRKKKVEYESRTHPAIKGETKWESNIPYRKERKEGNQQNELQDLNLMSHNIRGFNEEEKQQMIGELIRQEKALVILLNETKLTIPAYLDNYWSHQTVLQRNGRRLDGSHQQG